MSPGLSELKASLLSIIHPWEVGRLGKWEIKNETEVWKSQWLRSLSTQLSQGLQFFEEPNFKSPVSEPATHGMGEEWAR